MKKLSLKGLADFMTTTQSNQRKILRAYKYPSEDEASAKILYYREARDRISAYHSGSYSVQWLNEKAANLDALAHSSHGPRRTRLKHNARALKEYAKNFGKKKFDILGDMSLGLHFGDVLITVYPDLHVAEKGIEKVIKLGFGKKAPEPQKVKIINQCLLEAAMKDGHDITSSCVLYYDVPRGGIYKGARMGSRMANNIDAACKNISAIWESI